MLYDHGVHYSNSVCLSHLCTMSKLLNASSNYSPPGRPILLVFLTPNNTVKFLWDHPQHNSSVKCWWGM